MSFTLLPEANVRYAQGWLQGESSYRHGYDVSDRVDHLALVIGAG
jgi:hypothetical protein